MYVSLKSNHVIFLFGMPGYDFHNFLSLFKKESLVFELYNVRHIVSCLQFKSQEATAKVEKMANTGDTIPVKFIHKAVFSKPFPKGKLIVFLNFPEQTSHSVYFRDNVLHDPDKTFSITLNHDGLTQQMRKTIGKSFACENAYVKMATRYTKGIGGSRMSLRLPEQNNFSVDEIPNRQTAREIIDKFGLKKFMQSPTLF